MKIAIRGMGSADLLNKLEESGASMLVGGIHNELFFDSHWPNSDLADFLRKGATHGPIDLNPWMEFSRKEIDESDFLRIRCRKIISESQTDFERTRADVDSLDWIGEDPKRRFRLPRRIFLSKIQLKPNQIGGVGDWSAEYIVPRGVRSVFEQEGLSGFKCLPVFNTRTGDVIGEYFQIYSDYTLAPRHLDLASPETYSSHREEQGYDALGCLCYESSSLDSTLDFNRTGEDLVSFEFPDWVVRSSVRDCVRQHKLKGWAFEPVLTVGSERYHAYCELWRSLYTVLNDCGEHTIRGQKPWRSPGISIAYQEDPGG